MKHSIQVGGLAVAYIESGDGEPFVLVHGAGANRNYWRSLTAALTATYDSPRIIAPDLYGHGETPAFGSASAQSRNAVTPLPAYSYADDVELLACLTHRIARPFCLIGHSSGGAVCLEYAVRHPDRVRQLVVAEPMLPGILVDADPAAYAEVHSAYERAHDAVAAGEQERAARHLFDYILGDGEWHQLSANIRGWMTANVACTLAAHSKASLALRPEVGRYRVVRCPTLLLCGERTRQPFRCICERVAASVDHAQLTIIAGAAHNAPLTHAALVNAAILDFF